MIIMTLHLAVTDLVTCMLLCTNYFVKHGGAAIGFRHPSTHGWCQFIMYMIYFFYNAGLWSLGVLAVIRALSVVSEKWARIFTKKKIFFIILPIMYIVCILCMVPTWMEVNINAIAYLNIDTL